ncbi:sodium:proton antiporter [Pseudoalteromonas rubra]|uniref:Sodium:proton antiporter n=1 Tax=Pseudoalteromonas rubra TaxID=43658 RepID=A0A5S3WVM0_9GAMM|nr:DUF4040 domain-containing protein [Pseudoalteromonas rubra]TMP28270.1 sodium:proton antiporter [Pseudoalteromonas rubra]TMP34270.1 sodium:proton antiporter [Pseudoalteromonas rubra]TMP34972.1 sodium:proton antiporter [Pseudoalteromonas rubra]
MISGELFIDLLLGIGALVTAILCLTAKDLFQAILLFISMGLLVTLAWVRLGAWDVAIAEAAIGAGLTGALLIATRRQLNQ